MMLDFRNTSVKGKLMGIILFTSTVVLLLSTTAFVANELLSFRQTMITDLKTLAELVGRNASGSLLFFDRKTAEEDLKSLAVEPNITHALIFSTDGTVFARYIRQDPNGAPPATGNHAFYTAEPGHFIRDDHIDVVTRIVFDEEVLGSVLVRSDLKAWEDRIYRYMAIVFSVLLFSLLLAFILASRLQRIITGPIYELAGHMRNITRHQSYSLRANKTSDDELGTLIDGFNEMLTELEEREQAISKYQTHLEDLVAKRTEQLSRARDQALAASHAKSLFLANMSHEIRTPMNAILGYAQIVQGTTLNSEQRDALHIIIRSGHHLLGLINDILDISKIEAGEVQLNVEPFDLTELITTLSDMFRLRCEQKRLMWQVGYPQQGLLPVYGDQGKLRQVLINLLGNAVKFTDSGYVSLSIRSEKNERYQFEIKDSGAGIPVERQKDIFSLFHQDRAGLEKGGTGLGLNIAKRQIEAMGGELELISEIDQGACFRFSLALATADQEQLPKRDTGRKVIGLKPGTQISALVVDDAQENRDLLSMILSKIGVTVHTADNGKQALEQLRGIRPDIILMDIRMPVMDGIESLRHIQDRLGHQRPKCVAVTASTFSARKDSYLKAGFDDFISKPFGMDAVFNCLSHLLGVEYEYAVTAEPEEATVREPTTIHLPKSLYYRLWEAAELGQITDLYTMLDELKEWDPKTGGWLAEQINGHLSNIDTESILELLEQHNYEST